MQVTARNISSLPPGTHRAERCLYLRKRDGHAPTWIFRYTISGKQKDVVIGTSDAVSIAQAKETAVRFRTMIADGVDPLAAKQERREKMRNAGANVDHPFTFADLVAEALPVIIRSKAWRNQKHAAQWKSTLEQYAMPSLGSLFVDEVTRDDILSVLEPIWKTKPETASRLRGRLEAVFAYAIAIGKRAGGNPATWRGNLEMFLPPITKMKKEKHHDALTLDQARLLFDGWRPPTSITACAILFGALTASRVGEFVPAKWDEIDLRRKVWLCPPERRKDGKSYPHRVPLCRQLVAMLKMLPRNSPYVFAGHGGSHISKETPRVVIQKKIGHGTMHGFRSTFRDWCAENGKDPIVAEKSLMHATGNAVVQAYQRSDLLDARIELMQEWADAVYPLDSIEKES